jgi:hypothetical protein
VRARASSCEPARGPPRERPGPPSRERTK